MKSHFIVLLLTTSALWAAEPLVVTKDSASTFYKNFPLLTPKPRFLSPQIFFSCVGPSKEVVAKEKARTGPHYNGSVLLYANPSAAAVVTANGAVFPEGAVIVKEKLGVDQKVAAIGGMIKRSSGYDPDNGDWEFFYSIPGGEFTTGKLANCVDCHNGGTRDHVFSLWGLKADLFHTR
jgi:hypothetical protein